MEILHDLKMQFVDLLLVMWIFWGQIGHKNYEDFEHPTLQGVLFITSVYPGRCPGLSAIWAFSPLLFNIDSLSSMLFKSFYRLNKALITYKFNL